MLLKSWHKTKSSKGECGGEGGAASALLCFLLGIQAVTALARVDNNWSQRRPNVTVAQNHWGLAGGNRPQLSAYNRNNQTFGGGQHPQFQQTTVRPGAAAIGFRNNHTLPIRNQPNYPSNPINNRGSLNQTRPNWGQPPIGPQHPAYSQNTFNQTGHGWPQPQLPNQPAYPAHGHTLHNYTRPSATPRPINNMPVGPAYPNQSRSTWPQPSVPYVPQNPSHGQVSFNQSRPSWSPVGPAYPNHPQPAWPQPQHPVYNQSRPGLPQPSVPYVPQNPSHGQVSFNQSRPSWSPVGPAYPNQPQHPAYNQSHPSWPQPSAPQQPNYPYNPALPASNLYPQLPTNPNTKPAVPPHSWTPTANQTHLYPQLPNQNLPPSNSNGIPLAPLQPQGDSQGPHNWHSSGQSALSYGPGYYPPAAANANNNNPSKPQGSSNPYANMFI